MGHHKIIKNVRFHFNETLFPFLMRLREIRKVNTTFFARSSEGQNQVYRSILEGEYRLSGSTLVSLMNSNMPKKIGCVYLQDRSKAMHADFNIFQILILTGAVNGFVWSLLIFFKLQNGKVNHFLGAFVFLFALASIKIVLQEQIPFFNSYIPIPLLYQFTFGPLLYLYLRKSFEPNTQFSPVLYWHFLPSLLFDVCPALFLFIFYRHRDTPEIAKSGFLLDVLAFISFTLYSFFSWRMIRKYQKAPAFNQNKALVKWTRNVLLASLLIVLTWLIYILWVLGLKGRPVLGLLPYYPVYLVLSCCIYGLGIAGYYRPEIGLLEIPVAEKKQLIPQDVLQVQKETVLELIKRHRYYQDESLSLQTLARELNMPVKEFSYLVNTGFGMNFADFINEFRVNDFKERLEDTGHRQYSLLGLAYDAGFSSKASFYRAFKKSTGQTPAAFYKSRAALKN